MWQQRSFENEENKGILYLIPTPIGNLEDISLRALRLLKEVDVIACEDTRNTKKLCNHFDIHTPLVSYHEHNKETCGPKLIQKLMEGAKIALVSDAGMPTISDPGYELVVQAIEKKLTVVPLPGANAALTALTASGLVTQPFYFYGFLPRVKKKKLEEVQRLSKIMATLILYEAPHRLKETLKVLYEHLGNRKIALCRELTKKYEEFIRGSIEEVIQWAEENEIRGEFVLIIEGENEISEEECWCEHLSIKEHVDQYMMVNGMSSKEAIKQVAKDRNMQKREVYEAYHIKS